MSLMQRCWPLTADAVAVDVSARGRWRECLATMSDCSRNGALADVRPQVVRSRRGEEQTPAKPT
eukprot:2783701-Prorocentrum_lima.AAC.1